MHIFMFWLMGGFWYQTSDDVRPYTLWSIMHIACTTLQTPLCYVQNHSRGFVLPRAMVVPVMVPITTLRSKIPRLQQFCCCWDVPSGVRCLILTLDKDSFCFGLSQVCKHRPGRHLDRLCPGCLSWQPIWSREWGLGNHLVCHQHRLLRWRPLRPNQEEHALPHPRPLHQRVQHPCGHH